MKLWGIVPKILANPNYLQNLGRNYSSCFKQKEKSYLTELAVSVGVGEVFVKATYNRKGDGPLAPKCYKTIIGVCNSIQVHHWPNTAAVTKRIVAVLQREQYWMSYAGSCVHWGLDYFDKKFFQDLTPLMDAFKSTHL